MSVTGWRDIGVLIARLMAKEPPYLAIAIGLCVAFALLMIMEGLRASFLPRRTEHESSHREQSMPHLASADFRSAPVNIAKLPRNPKRQLNVVKSHRMPRPAIRRDVVKTPEQPSSKNLPQVASFGD